MKPNKKAQAESQSARFIEAAKKAETEMSGAKFEKAFKKIVKSGPVKSVAKKRKTAE